MIGTVNPIPIATHAAGESGFPFFKIFFIPPHCALGFGIVHLKQIPQLDDTRCDTDCRPDDGTLTGPVHNFAGNGRIGIIGA